MQTRRRHAFPSLWAVIAAFFAAAILLAGCSSSSGGKSSESLPDAATLLKESAQTTRELKSVHLELTVNGQIKDLPIKTLSGDLTNSPAVAAKGKAKISFQGSDVDADFIVIDGTLYVALSPNSWLDMGPAADIYDVSVILNPDTGLANVLANFNNPKSEGTETVNGVETVRVTGQVSADAVNKIAAQIGATGPVPGTAWIQKDNPHNLVQAKLEPTPGNSIQMTLSEWDKPVTVTKPAV
jgi:lipoprotein LprG